MKMIKYIAVLTLMTGYSQVMSMQFDEARCHQIKEAGKTANIEMAKKLLDDGMNINARGFLGYSMLVHAISYLHETDNNRIPQQKRLEFITFLIQRGAELNPKTDCWTEVPMLTASCSNIGSEIIDLFIKHGANINITHPSNGCSALHLAARNGKLDVVNFLLTQKNICINGTDNEGETPLISAAFWGYAAVVGALLKSGADVTIKDRSKRKAADYAISCDYEDGYRSRWQTIYHLLPYDTDLQKNISTSKAKKSLK